MPTISAMQLAYPRGTKNPKAIMRNYQLLIAIATIIVSCYAMMIVHEFGHCLGAAMTNGEIRDISVPIIGFSYTDIAGSSHPLFVTWAGPVTGVLLPWFALAITPILPGPAKHIPLFFCGFCFITNGAYIGVGSFLRTGDCADLLKYGAELWQLRLFAIICIPIGLYTWHRIGHIDDWFAIKPPQRKTITQSY